MGKRANHHQHFAHDTARGIDPTPVWGIDLSTSLTASIRLITTLTATIATTAIVYQFYLSLRTQQKQLRVEHRRSEELLHNYFLLPSLNDSNCKNEPSPITFQVTVIFADIVGFTKMSEEMEPEKLLYVLNKFFGELIKLPTEWASKRSNDW